MLSTLCCFHDSTLSLGPSLLKRRIISVRVFIVSCVMPLFTLPYLLYLFITRRHQKGKRAHQFSHVENSRQNSKFILQKTVSAKHKDMGTSRNHGMTQDFPYCWREHQHNTFQRFQMKRFHGIRNFFP